MSDSADQRVLVVAPDRDCQLTCEILSRGGLTCATCRDEHQLRYELARGAGALICAEEALSDAVRHELKLSLDAQPPWSDLPVLVVATTGDHGGRLASLAAMRSVAVLSRPMAIDTLVTAVKSALRARNRQYEVRDLLHERDNAARRKDEFLAMLAHELRNPLAPVRYAVQILGDLCNCNNEKVSHAISLVDRQVAHMARLIEDLLDVSRLTRGAVRLQLDKIDLVQLQRDVVASREGIAKTKRVALEMVAPEHPIYVNADAVRLTQVIDNLIDNAIKFTQADSRIEVGSKIENGQAVMWVKDDGEGLDPTIKAHLFESFAQADRSLDRNRGGLGLGLSIVHGIVALHGGEVTAQSDGPEQGSTFTVTMPIVAELLNAKSQAATSGAAELGDATSGAVSPGDAAERGDTGPERMNSKPGELSDQLKVLVVEDNQASAELLRMMLSLYGHVVEVAHSGQEGIEKAQHFSPDVMLCDIGLPGMNGYEVAEAIRSRAAVQAGRLVALTGYGDPEHRSKAFQAGFDAHLVKPVNPRELLAVLRTTTTTTTTSATE